MNALDLLATLQRHGFTLRLLPEGKFSVTPADRITEDLRRHLRECKGEVLVLLTRPHINERGELIIPFASAPQYHWWAGGQSIRETLRELSAPPDVFARYVESDSILKRMQ
jgi:hypothetical protein